MDKRSNNSNNNQSNQRTRNNRPSAADDSNHNNANRFRHNNNRRNRSNRDRHHQTPHNNPQHQRQHQQQQTPKNQHNVTQHSTSSTNSSSPSINDDNLQQQQFANTIESNNTTTDSIQGGFVPSQLDLQADEICDEVHGAIVAGMDSTFNMPLSEHIYYSSFESYDNIMIQQRRELNEAMSKLSECSDKQYVKNIYNNSMLFNNQQLGPQQNRIDYASLENPLDKYDAIHDFSEYMFDKIGQNLDDAEGFTIKNAQMIQATLEAANQNKLISHYSKTQQPSNDLAGNLSSSSSSSSLSRPTTTETSHRIKSSEQPQRSTNYQDKFTKPQQSKVVFNPVKSVVQSIQPQQTKIQKQYGGYLGKQHYGSPTQRYAQLENKNLPRPQNSFKDRIDNSYRPFEPLIKIKPNAKKPLRLDMRLDEPGNEYYSHPYEHEIQTFPIKEEFLTPTEPIEPPELTSTPITLVETLDQLQDMCRHIEEQKEFAVDVEHHSYRSFQGITCLLQISTRTQDFVIDAIKLRSELYRLNESFTNPDIVKVFHGADCDILWLQRDFGVYVVNLFDTSRAAKLMKFAHLSLAFLLKHYCNVNPDKSYQLADWRERPLPLPMLQYARADTHYLLYIYDRLKSDLSAKGGQYNKSLGVDLLRNVYERGRDICLKRYEKPPFSDSSHLAVLRKSRSTFNAKQMFAFKELYAWRDSISRELDESVGFVLPNNLMIRIAEYLPREPQGITALCNPIPPTVKKYLSDIHAIILKAIDVPLDESSKVTTGSHYINDISARSVDLDTLSHKQDIAHSAGVQEGGLVNLLDRMQTLNCSDEDHDRNKSYKRNSDGKQSNNHRITKQHTPQSRLYNFFDASWSTKIDNWSEMNLQESINKQFVSPFHRYEARNKN